MITQNLATLMPLSAAINGPAAADDMWYTNRYAETQSGAAVTPETALQSDAFWACLKLICNSMGYAPWIVYHRLANGGRERAPEHPLYSKLHDQPNKWQTAFEWKSMMAGHIILRGHAYNKIVPGLSGPFDQFIPMNPDRTIEEILASGVHRYRYRNEQGQEEILSYDQVFHIPGLWGGKSILEAARENLGEVLAAQNYSASGMKNRVTPPGALKYPGTFKDEEVLKRLRGQFSDTYAGPSNSGKPLILENGMEWQQLGLSNKDAEFLGLRQMGVPMIARRFGVPLTLIGYESNTSNFGTGVEQYSLQFAQFCMLHWFGLFEARASMELMVDPANYYTEFLLEAILRGDSKTQAEVMEIEMRNGGLNPDEWRIIKNRNPIEDGAGKEYFRSANLIPLGQLETRITETVGGPVKPSTNASVDPRAARLATVLAGSIVRKETDRVKALAKRYSDDGLAWEAGVREFYAEMAEDVAQRCYVEPERASAYADRWCGIVLKGAIVAESWEDTKTPELVDLILGGS